MTNTHVVKCPFLHECHNCINKDFVRLCMPWKRRYNFCLVSRINLIQRPYYSLYICDLFKLCFNTVEEVFASYKLL